ncbi:MAG: LysM peptidoglycan-binding domain-containing M23 family metallopeptidase [Fusobacteriaceae bacterium]|nr:LysM peptidoglycan-binding domain-containing M23 family metallopeptidase [Fusobacteriaceae bacterium]
MAEDIRRNATSLNRIVYNIANFKLGKIATVTFFTLLFFIVISIFAQMYFVPTEIVDLGQFTEYFEKSGMENGGLEVLDDIYYTFERKYNFTGDLKKTETLAASTTTAEPAETTTAQAAETAETKQTAETTVVAQTAGTTEAGAAEPAATAEAPAETAKKELPQTVEYVIKKGDRIESIAKAHNVSPEAILANNPDINRKSLKVGDKINILLENGVMYKIVKGDSLYKIAGKFKIKVDDILAYNDVNAKNLKIGQSIFIINPDFEAIAKNTAKKQKDDMRLPKADKNINIAKNVKPAATQQAAEKADTSKKTVASRVAEKNSGGGTFRYPVNYAGVASPFGNRFHPILRRYVLHTGVDLVARYVPLTASRGGKVSFAGYMGGYGKIIILKHPDGYETRYAHLNNINTSVGAEVKAGQLIGKTGMTGRVTGPHLHFEIRKDGQVKNPMKYLGMRKK